MRLPDSGQAPVVRNGSTSDAAIELRDVSFTYPGGTPVLSGVTASIRRGSIVGIIGPSGAGKTTLLHLIADLLQPGGGTIERRPMIDRHPVSMVFQKDTLLPWLTAEQNVRLYASFKVHKLKNRRLNSLLRRGSHAERLQELDKRVGLLLRLAHLEDKANAYPYQLSGGMRRRLALLTGVAPQPQLLLLDEPFSSVDEPTRIGIHQDVFEIIRTLGMTAILASHDLGEVITLCDRVLILTNRPVRVAEEHVIEFGQERNMLDLRAKPEFLDLYGRLWEGLSAQIAAGLANDEPGL